MTRFEITEMITPIGEIRLAVRHGELCSLGFREQWPALVKDLEVRWGPIKLVESSELHGFVKPLNAYFQGNVGTLDALPVRLRGTPFQEAVWNELRRIPAGTTISYGELAGRVGRPGAQRAVGAANGANPVSIVVPCHRVIRSDGSLSGYGGGADRKKWLLAHEGAIPATAERGSVVQTRLP